MDSNATTLLRTCFKCNSETETTEKKCARCGKRLITQREMRWRGLVLVFCGGCLTIFMGAMLFWAANLLLQPSNSETLKLQGGVKVIGVLFGVFSFIFLFGAAILAAGVWQLIYGKRNAKIILILAVLISVMLIGGEILAIILQATNL